MEQDEEKVMLYLRSGEQSWILKEGFESSDQLELLLNPIRAALPKQV